MLTSIAIIIISGMCLGTLFQKLKLPSLMGYIIAGMIISPYALNLMSDSLLSVAADLRQVALIIILTRAGLSLDIEDLKRVGRPAVLMCFVPACFEMLGVTLLAPKLLGVSVLEAALIGSVIAAVSPAVIVPRMIKLIEEGWGKEHSIPQMILAGASVDDVFVIVVFYSFLSLASSGTMDVVKFVTIPISIVFGILVGCIIGYLVVLFFKKFHFRDTIKVLLMLSISFLLVEMETQLKALNIPVSGLLAIMSMGIMIKRCHGEMAKRVQTKYNKLWVGGELVLFVLVGVATNLQYAMMKGVSAILVVVGALCIRMIGVFVCLLKTQLTKNERLFCMMAYTPKATVQAAIGAIPLTYGLACGNTVLTVAVLAILITAPFGAICVDHFYPKLLGKD